MSSSATAQGEAAAAQLRRRSSSVSQAVSNITSPSTGAKQVVDPADAAASAGTSSSASASSPAAARSPSLFRDIYTMRWMTSPSSSAKIASVFLLGWVNWHLFTPHTFNIFEPFLFISHRVPLAQVLLEEPSTALTGDTVRYQKGYFDLCFIAFYVVVFSFLRQATTEYIFRPFARSWGIHNETKQVRLMEQGYSFLYWGTAGLFGLYVMSFQENWWFQTEHLWIKYPHWQMRTELKYYYLLQSAYWLQQALVMLLRLEKPRKDYYELVAHHLVTLWLIGWSYLISLTMIGTTVFVCMDVPDAWLALAKCLNYLALDKLATGVFALFMCVWTYFRIYLSAYTLYSVWTQFDLIPHWTRVWSPKDGVWLADWMRYQIFTPLFLLLCLNLFWYILMWRVMIRAINGVVADEREEGEYDEDNKGGKDNKDS